MSMKIKIGLHRSLYLFVERKKKKIDTDYFPRFTIYTFLAITR